jgi:hypothetical protein
MDKFINILKGNTDWDRRWRKRIYGVEEFPKIPFRARLVRFIFTMVFLACYTVMVSSFVWFAATGTLPFVPFEPSAVPPDLNPSATSQQVEQVVDNGGLNITPYGEGNNCVEMAFLAARQFWWEGYEATVIKIDFTDGSGHMLVGVPTTDEGWKFFEPQSESWVSPRLGGFYINKQITGLSYLYDFVWKSIGE